MLGNVAEEKQIMVSCTNRSLCDQGTDTGQGLRGSLAASSEASGTTLLQLFIIINSSTIIHVLAIKP